MWTAEHRERYKDDGRRYPSDLTDAEWETIAPHFAVYQTLTADRREMVNACLYLHKTGCGWRYLPQDFGPWETVRTWHDRFHDDGIWSEIGGVLTRAVRQQQGHAAEPSTAILDSQSVVSGPQKGERGVDGNKNIKGIVTAQVTAVMRGIDRSRGSTSQRVDGTARRHTLWRQRPGRDKQRCGDCGLAGRDCATACRERGAAWAISGLGAPSRVEQPQQRQATVQRRTEEATAGQQPA